jgi:hypothetical protein
MPHPLHHLAGTWAGPARTWLDASGAPDESTWRVEIETLLDDRFVRLRYHGTCQGKPHTGEMTLGADDVEHTMYWIDTFHTGNAPLWSTGPAGPDLVVQGSYRAGPERWGWRTVYRLEDDQFVVDATNIWPSGREEHAIEVRLTRLQSAS